MAAPYQATTTDGQLVDDKRNHKAMHAHFEGNMLRLAHAAWLGITGLCLGIFVWGIPVFFDYMHTRCIDADCSGVPMPPGGEAGLAAVGLSPTFYVTYVIVINVIFVGVHLSVAGMIFRRRSTERVALLGALMLVTWGIGGWSNIILALAKANAAWRPIGWTMNTLGLVSFSLFFCIFPDGHFVPRWSRWWILALTPILVFVFPEWGVNSLPVPAFIMFYSVWLLSLAGIQIYRYRQVSDRVQRQQTKWVVVGVATAAIGILVVMLIFLGLMPSWQRNVFVNMAAFAVLYGSFLLIPLTIGLAILRSRLWDIAPILNRTLAYGGLWLGITFGYIGLTAVLGIAAGTVLPASLAILITIIGTQLFQPVRRRLEQLANRWVFGERLSRAELLTRLGTTLESAYDLHELLPQVSTMIQQGLQITWVRVCLDQPSNTLPVSHMDAVDSTTLIDTTPTIVTPLIHAGEHVGTIDCGPKLTGTFDDHDRDLLTTLARQVALAIHNARLSAELTQRLDQLQRQTVELTASRARIVQAGEEERRRIERNIHDGVQQQIVALLAKISLARNQLSRDARLVERTLIEVREDAGQMLEDLRELVHGIHPPILSDRGIVEAIHARVARLPIPVTIAIEGMSRNTRYAEKIEGAAYFFVCEGLANVLKHAAATHTTVSLSAMADTLRIEVIDDGRGFDPNRRSSFGLRGLADRIAALGGELQIHSAPGQGTRLTACLPILEEVHD